LHLCGTSWASWTGQTLVTLGDCHHVAGPVIGWSLSGRWWLFFTLIGDCKGFLCLFPTGDSRKATLVKPWLVECSLVWFLWRPRCRLGVWCQLACEPPSSDSLQRERRLPANNRTARIILGVLIIFCRFGWHTITCILFVLVLCG
jgi:hypothetical protein